jgi:hypothetical protein
VRSTRPAEAVAELGSLGICRAIMQNLTINKRSLLRVLLGVYLFPLALVIFSLSVPPADLPLCGLMFALAAFGLFLARRESRTWRVVWTSALVVSILCGVLEIVAGQRIAQQRSKHDSSRLTMPNQSPEPTRMTPSILRLSVLLRHVTVPTWLSFFR